MDVPISTHHPSSLVISLPGANTLMVGPKLDPSQIASSRLLAATQITPGRRPGEHREQSLVLFPAETYVAMLIMRKEDIRMTG